MMETPVVQNIEGQILELQPEGALLWRDRSTLFVADLHVGKAASYRKQGVALPLGTTADDLSRLSAVLDRTLAERLVVLGDFFHDRTAREDRFRTLLAAWKSSHASLDWIVVAGNHDVRSGPPDPVLGVTVVPEGIRDGPFSLCHDPEFVADGYALAGHIHPVVRLRDGKARLRLPCFHFRRDKAILPAFSLFTGGAVISPTKDDAIFVLAEGSVVRVQ